MTERLIDKLKADFAERKTRVEVMGIEVFVTPLTMGEQMKVSAMHPDDTALRNAEIFVQKCRDADGNPVFTKEDKQALKHQVAGDSLSPLINGIFGTPAAAQEKNSETGDPSTGSDT